MYFMCKRIFFLWLSNIHDLTHTPLFFLLTVFVLRGEKEVQSRALITPTCTTWWIPGPTGMTWWIPGIVQAFLTPTCITW